MRGIAGDSELKRSLEQVVADVIQNRDVGLAIAVVNRSDVLLCEAHGNRTHAEHSQGAQPASVNTMFALGSLTKPFTSFLLKLAAEHGFVALDKPLREIDASFGVRNPRASAGMTLEDILCQRGGIPRHDAMWYLAGWSPDEIWARLRYLDPDPDFRFQYKKGFQYNNLLYAMAGRVLCGVTGTPWDVELDRQVLAPLSITSMSVDADSMQPSRGDVAAPYMYLAAQPIPLAFKNLANIAPAGALNCGVAGLIPWLLLLTNEGVAPDGSVVLSKTAFRDLLSARVHTHRTPSEEYGLGWFLREIEGNRLAFHTGNSDGFSAWMGVLPDDDFAIAVLSNEHAFRDPSAPQPLASLLGMAVAHDLLGLSPRPAAPPAAPGAPGRADPPGQPPSRSDLEDLVGTYRHEGYGDVEAELADDALVLHYQGHSWPLSPTDGGGFRFPLFAFGAEYSVTPLFFDELGVKTLALPFEPQVGWIRFRRP